MRIKLFSFVLVAVAFVVAGLYFLKDKGEQGEQEINAKEVNAKPAAPNTPNVPHTNNNLGQADVHATAPNPNAPSPTNPPSPNYVAAAPNAPAAFTAPQGLPADMHHEYKEMLGLPPEKRLEAAQKIKARLMERAEQRKKEVERIRALPIEQQGEAMREYRERMMNEMNTGAVPSRS